MKQNKPSDHLKKIMAYCARAERCRQDVVKKLTVYGTPEEEFDTIIDSLYADNFLNDDRYVRFYTSDKWKLDQWGRIKIRNGLFRKGFSESLIDQGLATIDEDEYKTGVGSLLARKRDTIQSADPIEQMKKILSFGSHRGIEEELIWQWLQQEGLSF
jgi:regulatory protein